MPACFAWPFAAEDASGFIIDPGHTPWQRTASGRRSGRGEAGTLTWSIVPDGTSITDGLDDFGGSDLIEFLNDNFDGDPSEVDHTQQPWFSIFEDALGRWDEISGLDFVYEPNDDGGNHSERPGILGVRGDIRFSGASIDGVSGVLAFNFFPEFGGDMAIDTDETGFARRSNNFRFFRSTIMHEIGHAIGLDHVVSTTDDLLMDAFADPSIDGPQLDEVRGAHFYFGDAFEAANNGQGNDIVSRATDLGDLVAGGSLIIGADADVRSQAIPTSATDFVSISHDNDIDFYSFTVDRPGTLNAELTPLGGVFNQSGDNQDRFDANARIDLSIRILDQNGRSSLVFEDEGFAGETELAETELTEPGTYFARIEGLDEDSIQLYMLDLSFTGAPVLGDCNGDGVVDGADLNCACSGDLNETLAALGTIPGDFDLNGVIEFADFLRLSRNFGEEGGYADGDIDCSGDIGFPDFLTLAQSFGNASSASATSVPEPSSSWLAVMAVCLMARFCRGSLRRSNV